MISVTGFTLNYTLQTRNIAVPCIYYFAHSFISAQNTNKTCSLHVITSCHFL